MGRDVKAVLFDLDGTLVDSLPELYEGVRRAMIDLGHQSPSKEQVRDMIGRGVQVLVQRILDSQSLPTDAESREALLQPQANILNFSQARLRGLKHCVLLGLK